VRVIVIPFLVAVGLLLIALVLPSKQDTSVAAWWTRVRYQMNFFARVVLALACIGGLVWYVLLPFFGWRSLDFGN
jgi:hypothetical protein